MSSIPQLLPTVGVISQQLHQPVHRVEYVLRTRHIRPAGHAGRYRLYTEADVERIATELRKIELRKDGGA